MTYLEKEEDFDKLIEKGDVLVDFFATWCGPCKMLSPVLEELSDHFERVKVVKVDIDQFEDLTRRHGIMSVPTMEIYKDGKLVKKEVGYHDYDTIASWFLR
ncbi:MAG TPA: thioredoxin [Candidatus Onthousia faecigallinarum]|nr:thioredoxin [Candidatus Onthousia faecigallinarum]